MSRASKRENRKKKYLLGFIPKRLWPVVVLVIGALAITGVVLLISQESALPAGFVPKVSGAPALEIEQPFFELGDMQFNAPANVTYVLRNMGERPLRILEVPQVQVLAGC